MIKFSNKNFFFLRVLIYLSGTVAIFFMVYLVSLKTKQVEFPYLEKGSGMATPSFDITSTEYFDTAEVFLNIKNNVDVKSTEVKITKMISVLNKNRGDALTSPEELNGILFDENNTPYPNGTIISFKSEIFLLSKGKMRKFSSKELLNLFKLNNEDTIKINRRELGEMEYGKNIDEKNIYGKQFPSGIIIKSGDDYFITGTNSIYPIFSVELIRSVWENFNYIETNSKNPHGMIDSKCFIESENNIRCHAEIEELAVEYGNVYSFQVFGIPSAAIEKFSVKLKKENFLKNFGKLFW